MLNEIESEYEKLKKFRFKTLEQKSNLENNSTAEMTKLEKNKQKLKDEIKNLEYILEDNQEEIKKHKVMLKQNQDLSIDIKSKSEKVNELKKQLDQLKCSIEKGIMDVDEKRENEILLSKKYKSIEEQIKNKNLCLEEIEKSIYSKEIYYNDLFDKVIHLNDELKYKEEEIEDFEVVIKEFKELKNSHRKKGKELKKILEEVERLDDIKNTLSSNIIQQEDSIQKLSLKINNMESQIEEKNISVYDKHLECSKLTEDLEELDHKYSKSYKDLENRM